MHLASIRIITDDVARLVAFYEQVTGTTATGVHPDLRRGADRLGHAGHRQARPPSNSAPRCGRAGANRIASSSSSSSRTSTPLTTSCGTSSRTFVTEPTTMPWGNRSLLFRDPDGNLVNPFTPVTAAARQKFGRHDQNGVSAPPPVGLGPADRGSR